jgi:hypothetical protein
MPLKVKQTYAALCIGFNNSSLPLGLRNDLHILYERAKKTNNKAWLDMFETAPTEKEIDKVKEENFNEKQSLKTNA